MGSCPSRLRGKTPTGFHRVWTYDKALSVIRAYVAAATDDRGVVLEERTLDRPYGWVFFYQSRLYIETGDVRHALVGIEPVLFNRISGEYRALGSAHPVEDYLREYEAQLPRFQLEMTPQRRTP